MSQTETRVTGWGEESKAANIVGGNYFVLRFPIQLQRYCQGVHDIYLTFSFGPKKVIFKD